MPRCAGRPSSCVRLLALPLSAEAGSRAELSEAAADKAADRWLYSRGTAGDGFVDCDPLGCGKRRSRTVRLCTSQITLADGQLCSLSLRVELRSSGAKR